MASSRPVANHQPIVGRERERELLREILDAAIGGHGSLVLISGEAGIGKTTLVQDLVHVARKQDALVLVGGCYDLTVPPLYGPWSGALRRYQPEKSQPPVPVWFTDPDAMGEVGSQTALFEEIRRFFTAIAASRPLVIVLEDLHWADPASLEALRYLGRTLSERAILLVVTYREDELTRRHGLYQLLPLLVRESQAQRIHLQRLGQDGIRALIQSEYELAAEDLDHLTRHIADRSEGNPLFATELLRGLEDESALSRSDAGWRLGDLASSRIPTLLRQMFDARLGDLSEESRDAIQAAAVIGQEIPLDLWQSVAELSESDIDRVIGEAIEAGLLAESRGTQQVAFRHALIREAVYDSLIASRRRVWHRQTAEALAETPGADPDVTAHHFLQAGDERAGAWLIRAGARAETQYAMGIAAHHYDTAQALMKPESAFQRARGWLLAHIGHLLRFIDRERSRAYLDDAIALAQQTGDPILTAAGRQIRGILFCWGGDYQHGLADMEAAKEISDAATDEQRADAREVVASIFPRGFLADDRTLSFGGFLFLVEPLPGTGQNPNYVRQLANAGRFHDCVNVGEQYVANAAAATDDEARVQLLLRDSYHGMADAYDMLGEPERAQSYRQLALAVYRSLDHYMMLGGALMSEMWHLLTYHPDDIAARHQTAAEAMTTIEAANRALDVDTATQVHAIPLHLLEGRWDRLRELEQLQRHARVWSFQRRIWIDAIGVLAREEDDAARAWTEVRHRFPTGRPEPPGRGDFIDAVAAHELATKLCLDAGRLEEARRWLDSLETWLDWSGAVIGRAEAHHLWARYHHADDDPNAAREHAEKAHACASHPQQPLALITTHRLLGTFALQDKRYAEAGDHLREALALAEDCQTPYEEARSRLCLAELQAATGKADEAWRQIDRVRAICTPLGALRTLQRATAVAAKISVRRGQPVHPAGLTPREVEVLGLVAGGLTDAEVAEQLFISPRTVGVHLTSVYNKLGVNSRIEATRFAVEHGLVGSPPTITT